MMLRLMLVCLVTSMGLELPSSRDVSCWGESGSAWVNALVSGPTATSVEIVAAPEPVLALLPVDADLAFEAISGELVSDFTTDQTVTIAEVASCDIDCESSSSEAYKTVAVGLPDGEELATMTRVDDANEPDCLATLEPMVEDVNDDAPSAADRLASAVRLTCEAAQAWAAVIQDSAAEADCSR